MVELVALKMGGIRSIGDQPHLIHFLKPLTIIQGPNGTGKTTIIEALNYITTGALPAGKMQSFIHNNKLANQVRVDALVQLKFLDLKGSICTATKRMCSTTAGARNAAKPSTKSEEFTLSITDRFGNDKSISSKVSDFNKEMLNLLGVPKAILEHVIFCHQEESNWPLSEPKELKVRFDAIFEVTKYVKALDQIKKNIKDLELKLNNGDSLLPNLQDNMRLKANLQLNYDTNKTVVQQNKAAIERYSTEKKQLDERIGVLKERAEKATKMKYKLELLNSQIQVKRQFLKSIRIDDFNGNRQQLVEELNRVNEKIKVAAAAENERKEFVKHTELSTARCEKEAETYARQLATAERCHNEAENLIRSKRQQLNEHRSTIAKVAESADAVVSRLAEVRALLKKARTELGLMDGRDLLYEKWADEARSRNGCPLCDRAFPSCGETAKFAEHLRQQRENLPSEINALKRSVRAYEEEENRLVCVQPIISLAERLERVELPQHEADHRRTKEEMTRLLQKKEAIDVELGRLRDNVKGIQNTETDLMQKNKVHVLEDQLRKLDLQTELRDLEAQVNENKWDGKGSDDLIKAEYEELTKKSVELNNEIQKKLGEQKQIENKLREIVDELKHNRYADASKKYKKAVIERTVTASAIQDLSKFWKILDDSVISFHQRKMEQINQILRELWVRVYRGNDIETIKIKSQPVSGQEKKKSYDYSVVMTVNQTDIDMRAHCSAGQKMLASILIRIALADVFAGNCPILALDEPTTNLDADKVENIGEMLKSLLEVRNAFSHDTDFPDVDDYDNSMTYRTSSPTQNSNSSQRGRLQLLVITHDKRLVDHLFLACRPEMIYGLSKDENGNSIIRRHRRIYDDDDEENVHHLDVDDEMEAERMSGTSVSSMKGTASRRGGRKRASVF